MHKSLKGALAATSAAALLLGGAGTLAYWTDSQDTGGGNITSGSITLGEPDCTAGTGAHGWQVDGGATFVPGTTELVPGDSISKVCDMSLVLEGEHIAADLGMDAAGLTRTTTGAADTALASQLVADADYTVTVDGTPATPNAAGTYDVQATVTVTFNGADATDASQNGDVNLDAITLTATQTHDAS